MKYLITILFLFNCNFTFANHHANNEEKKEVVVEANKIYDVEKVIPTIYLVSELSRNKI